MPHGIKMLRFSSSKPKLAFVRLFSRKRLLLKLLMMVAVLAIISYLTLLESVANGFPLDFHSEAFIKALPDTLKLQELADSEANKAIFVHLQHSNNAFYDTLENVLGTLDFVTFHQYQRQPYVANGYIGSRIPVLGQGFAYDTLSVDVSASEDDLSNGWPLFNRRYAGAFAAGFFDAQKNTTETNFPWLLQYGFESVISAIPQWTGLSIVSHGADGKLFALDPQQLSDTWGSISLYVQNMSLADGVVSTLFVWLDSLHVQYDVFAHRDNPNLGVVDLKITNTASNVIQFNVSDMLSGDTAQRCNIKDAKVEPGSGIYLQYQPIGVADVYAATYSSLRFLENKCIDSIFSSSSNNVSQTLVFQLEPGEELSVSKFVGIVTSDIDPDAYKLYDLVLSKARATSLKCGDLSYVLTSHRNSWADIVSSGLQVEFPDDPLLTLATRSSLFHLSANTRSMASGVTAALSVGGLSSDSYAGMVFWDTDLWIMNGLLPWNPLHARSLINYRVHTHQQALDNIHSPLAPKYFQGAAYPWTSGRYGNCTSTGPCFDYEYHINFAVAIAAWEAYLSGAADDEFLELVAYPLINDAATFLASYVEYNDTLGKYTTRNLTDPDEYANHVDNGAYTNAAISLTMKWAQAVLQHLGKPVPELFTKILGNVHLPTSPDDDDIVLEYTGMNSSVGIKQADVIMITYPLENELITHDQAVANMEFYLTKQVSFGPAMTFPIFLIVASALQDTGCSSQSYLLKAVQPFLRGPFAQFSEQNNDVYKTNGGTHPAFPFMTAHGGLLQAVLKGLLGLRYDFRVENGKIVRELKLDPIKLKNLPGGVVFQGIHYMNHTLSLNLTSSGLVVTDHSQEPGSVDEIEIVLGSRLHNSTRFAISQGDQVVLPLFDTSEAFSNSLTECYKASFTNITDGAYGDATVLVNDGDNTTHWQGLFNTTGKILIDLKSKTKLTSGTINWGDRPPTSVKILISKNEEFELSIDYLSQVDFGNGLYKKYWFANSNGQTTTQNDVFDEVFSSSVSISSPFNIEDQPKIILPTNHNTTSIEFPDNTMGRFVLLEFDGVHDEADEEGAKLYEVVFS